MSKQTEALKLALNKAFQLGQRYWSWADSEYSSHWKKADAAEEQFNQLVEDTIREALAEQPAQRCLLCDYQHGHAIGCENNPVDIALNKMAENARELGLDYEPAQQEQGDSNCQDDDGCPTEMAVLQRFWRGEPIPTEHYPVWFRPAQQQEPVAWKWENKETGKSGVYLENPEKFFDLSVASIYDWTPLYTSPPASKPLTDEQWQAIADTLGCFITRSQKDTIEAALGIKE